MAEVDKLQKGDISEVKAYTTPPEAVMTTMSAVMTLFKGKTDWASGKKKLMEVDFLAQVKGFNKDDVSNKTVSALKKFTNQPDFNPTRVTGVSKAAGALCTWVCAIRLYCEVFRTVAPKKAALKKAMKSLSVKQKALAQSKAELQEVSEKVAALQAKFDASVGEKNRLRDEAEKLEACKFVGFLFFQKNNFFLFFLSTDIFIFFLFFFFPFPCSFRFITCATTC